MGIIKILIGFIKTDLIKILKTIIIKKMETGSDIKTQQILGALSGIQDARDKTIKMDEKSGGKSTKMGYILIFLAYVVFLLAVLYFFIYENEMGKREYAMIVFIINFFSLIIRDIYIFKFGSIGGKGIDK